MIELGRDILNSAKESTQREWLVTNGTGSYAAGTLSGILTRRYHGLLVTALKPPLGRTVLVSKFDETVYYDGHEFELFSNQWDEGGKLINPHGYFHLNTFSLEGTTPVWTYTVGDALLEKRVWMDYGKNTTYTRYTLLRSTITLHLNLKILVNYKDFHTNVHADDWQFGIASFPDRLEVEAFHGATKFAVHVVGKGDITPKHTWYRNYFLEQEAYRGLDATGDHLLAANIESPLHEGQTLTLVCTTEEKPDLNIENTYKRKQRREQALLDNSRIKDAPDWIDQLILAADQFIVQRDAGKNIDGRSIIAGYPWFGDWGRDTMISLPGLVLTTGRYEDAASILQTFAKYVDQGMLPNRFPDHGENPEYNTVDATLWYFEAVRQYFSVTQDIELIREIFPVLQNILNWHVKGTRYGIYIDPEDGLLYAGENQVQLTWMDAKVGDWVVTPRIGKAIEVNALWYNALCTTMELAQHLAYDVSDIELLANRVRQSFSRFWNADKNYCFDVLDSPTGNDTSLRPNQLFAVSLFYSPLEKHQQKAVVDHCARTLVTPHGLRSLAPFESAYIGRYGGDTIQRDGSYHQGTIWAWLIGTYIEAYLRVYQNPTNAYSYLSAFKYHLQHHCIGTVSEIFDGDMPFKPHGAVAQAWSVAEILRIWQLITNYQSE